MKFQDSIEQAKQIRILADNGDDSVSGIPEIIKNCPAEKQGELLDAAKEAITIIIENRNSFYIPEIIEAFPENMRNALYGTAGHAIDIIADETVHKWRYYYRYEADHEPSAYEELSNIPRIIKSFPENMQEQLNMHVLTEFPSILKIMEFLPEDTRENFLDLAKTGIKILADKGGARHIPDVMNYFLSQKDKLQETAKDAIKIIAAKAINGWKHDEEVYHISSIIKSFPENMRVELIETAKDAITILANNAAKNHRFSLYIAEIIEAFPENMRSALYVTAKDAIKIMDNHSQFTQKTMETFLEYKLEKLLDTAKTAIISLANCDTPSIPRIIASFPEDMRIALFGAANAAGSTITDKGGTYFIPTIIESFPKEMQKELLETAKDAITIMAAKGDTSSIPRIIESFPKEMRSELLGTDGKSQDKRMAPAKYGDHEFEHIPRLREMISEVGNKVGLLKLEQVPLESSSAPSTPNSQKENRVRNKRHK